MQHPYIFLSQLSTDVNNAILPLQAGHLVHSELQYWGLDTIKVAEQAIIDCTVRSLAIGLEPDSDEVKFHYIGKIEELPYLLARLFIQTKILKALRIRRILRDHPCYEREAADEDLCRCTGALLVIDNIGAIDSGYLLQENAQEFIDPENYKDRTPHTVALGYGLLCISQLLLSPITRLN